MRISREHGMAKQEARDAVEGLMPKLLAKFGDDISDLKSEWAGDSMTFSFRAKGFGITAEQLDNVRPPAAMDAINHYLWHINERGSVAEAIAATNLAIEWATGEWSRKVVSGMREYAKTGQAVIDRRTMAWLRAHAHYDDHHPHEAMELIKHLCTDDESRETARLAAKRGMEYYVMALDDCFTLHQPASLRKNHNQAVAI